MKPVQTWFAYLIECRDGSLYTGATTDVARRYAQHVAGKGARYTRSHPPARLLAVIACPDRSQALRTEYAIKQLPVAEKYALAGRHASASADNESHAGKQPRRPQVVRLAGPHPSQPQPSTPPAQRAKARYATATGDHPMLKIGDKAPAFSLASDSGATISSASLEGRRYVLYFYPRDDTPGCTREACAFRDQLPAFDKLGVPVFGLSADSEKAHARFVGKYALNFPLLSDPDHQLLAAYGAWVEKSLYGRKYMGIQRCTFVIGASGKIEQVWEKVSPDSHAGEVMAWLAGGPPPSKPAKAAAKKTATGKTVAQHSPAGSKPGVKAPQKKSAAKKTAATAPAKKTTKAVKPAAHKR